LIHVQATFGAEDPFLKRGKEPCGLLSDSVRYFICYGDGDEDAVVDSKTTQAALEGAGAPMVVVHQVPRLDHHMPKQGDEVYSKIMQAFADARAGKPVPAEHKPKPRPKRAPTSVPDVSDPTSTMDKRSTAAPTYTDVEKELARQGKLVFLKQDTKFDRKTGLNKDGKSPVDLALERKEKFRMNRGGPVDKDGNPLPGYTREKNDLDLRLEELCERLGRPIEYATWTIPPEAPPGWGMGNGDQWLRDNPEYPTKEQMKWLRDPRSSYTPPGI
jgi:hypothetical protein